MKKLLAIIVCVASLLAVAVFPASAEEAHERFTDVPEGKWYTKAIDWVCEKGYMTGTSETEFSPNAPVTREEFVATLFLIGTRNFPEVLNYDSYHGFSDIDNNAWYCKYIEYAFRKGCVAGVGNNQFGTGLPIKRQDAAVILARWASKPDNSLFGFDITDLDTASEYAKDSIKYVCSYIHYEPEDLVSGPLPSYLNPMFSGNELKQFMPHKTLSRAELAVLMYRIFERRYEF